MKKFGTFYYRFEVYVKKQNIYRRSECLIDAFEGVYIEKERERGRERQRDREIERQAGRQAARQTDTRTRSVDRQVAQN